jgi:hypothetical protein
VDKRRQPRVAAQERQLGFKHQPVAAAIETAAVAATVASVASSTVTSTVTSASANTVTSVASSAFTSSGTTNSVQQEAWAWFEEQVNNAAAGVPLVAACPRVPPVDSVPVAVQRQRS